MFTTSLWSLGLSSICSIPSLTYQAFPGVTVLKEVGIFELVDWFIFFTVFSSDGSWANDKCWSPDSGIPFNQSTPFQNGFTEAESETAVEQFWKCVLGKDLYI